MAYINNKKLAGIREAARGGNEKAQKILQALRKAEPQSNIDSLIADYFGLNEVEPQQEEVVESQPEIPTPVEKDIPNENDPAGQAGTDDFPAQEESAQPPLEGEPQMQVAENFTENAEQVEVPPQLEPEQTSEVQQPEQVVDLTEILDKETADLFDENDIDDLSFKDFLGNKKKDAVRAKKNADYFKAYDLNGRTDYMNKKIDAYKGKFDGKFKDIDRRYNDIGKSLDLYSTKANEMLDDDIELDMDKANNVYDAITGDEGLMGSMGRYWDDVDSTAVVEALKGLMAQYGKQNVIAALNTLKNDNEGYKAFLGDKINTEIGRYSKSVENLLK